VFNIKVPSNNFNGFQPSGPPPMQNMEQQQYFNQPPVDMYEQEYTVEDYINYYNWYMSQIGGPPFDPNQVGYDDLPAEVDEAPPGLSGPPGFEIAPGMEAPPGLY
jgi:hypothetical protein